MGWAEIDVSTRINSHQKAYVCIHVFENTRPVLLVSRADGDWCFLCGQDHEDNASSYRVVGIGHLFERDPSLLDLVDLPVDFEAERAKPGEPWIRTACDQPGA
jgi:hypothetical protein